MSDMDTKEKTIYPLTNNTMEEEILNWCLWVWEADTDYLLCDGDIDSLPNLYQQDEIIYEYNQYWQEWSKKSCTIFSAVGAVSDLFNYKFSIDEIKEIDDMSYTLTRVKWEWWYIKSAVDLVAKWWNNNKKLTDKYWKVAYYRVSRWDDDSIEKIISKWYTMVVGYNWNSKYNADYRADNVLNWTDFWPSTYWHATDLRKKNKRYIKDSTAWRPYNKYELDHKISEIKCFQSYGYVYVSVKQDSLEEIKRLNEFKTITLNIIELNSKLRHLTNDKNYKSILNYANNKNREKLKDIERELAKYS